MKNPVFCDRLFSYYFRSFASSSKFNFLQKVQVLFAEMQDCRLLKMHP